MPYERHVSVTHVINSYQDMMDWKRQMEAEEAQHFKELHATIGAKVGVESLLSQLNYHAHKRPENFVTMMGLGTLEPEHVFSYYERLLSFFIPQVERIQKDLSDALPG